MYQESHILFIDWLDVDISAVGNGAVRRCVIVITVFTFYYCWRYQYNVTGVVSVGFPSSVGASGDDQLFCWWWCKHLTAWW